jgi:DNA-binding XRE family transcriptional regulator
MTPAEKLASLKPWRREPRNGVYRRVVWDCKVREIRESLRVSIRDVAKAVKMSVTALWQIEMGGETTLSTARKLTVFFGKTVEELWPKKARKK